MKTAQIIVSEHSDAVDAMEQAELKAIAKDQIWSGDGYTIYVFDDNSFLAQSGNDQIAVDGDDPNSIDAYVAWLGVDVEYDLQRIQSLLRKSVVERQFLTLLNGTPIFVGDYLYSTYHGKSDSVESVFVDNGDVYFVFSHIGQASIKYCAMIPNKQYG